MCFVALGIPFRVEVNRIAKISTGSCRHSISSSTVSSANVHVHDQAAESTGPSSSRKHTSKRSEDWFAGISLPHAAQIRFLHSAAPHSLWDLSGRPKIFEHGAMNGFGVDFARDNTWSLSQCKVPLEPASAIQEKGKQIFVPP